MQKEKNFIKAAIIVIALGLIAFVVIAFLTLGERHAVDLPEEMEALSHDSTNPTPLYGWIDSAGIKRIEMREYLHKPNK